jgi:hypothetical protein
MSDAPSESETQCRSAQGKSSTSSSATVPEMLALEVTLELLSGAEPGAHQFYVTVIHRWVIEWRETQNNSISTLKLGQVCMSK